MSRSIHLFSTFVLFATSAVALAAMDLTDMPKLKDGLWTTQATNEGMAPTTHRMCVDADSLKQMLSIGQGMMSSMCAQSEMRRDGDVVMFESECSMGPMTLKSQGRTTFSGDTAYRTESTTQFDPPMMGRGTNRSIVEAEYTGPCPPNMKPGDIEMPDGRVMNIQDMQRMMSQPPR